MARNRVDNPFQPQKARLVQVPQGPTWDLTGNLLFLGKREDNDVVLEGRGVSRLHASLRLVDDGWRIEDRRSRCGVYVGEDEVGERILVDGDHLRLGSVTLRFDAERIPDQKKLAIRGLAVVAVLVVGLTTLIPRSGSSDSEHQRSAAVQTSDTLTLAHQKLCTGETHEAAKLFRRLSVTAPMEQRHAPRTLHRLASLFTTADQLETFRWDKATKQLEKAEELEGLPDETQAWIQERRPWVAAGLVSAEQIKRAHLHESRAAEELAAERFHDGVQALEAGLRTYSDIDGESPLAENARQHARSLRTQILRALTERADTLTNSSAPDYDEARELLLDAQRFAVKRETLNEIRSLIGSCERNSVDARRYADAVRIMRSQQVEAYPEAVQLLSEIDPRSRVWSMSKTWGSWLEADQRTRTADALYANGDARSALQLLGMIDLRKLDKRAVKAMQDRSRRWGRVSRAWERGRDLSRRHDPRAVDVLSSVLRHETDPTNRYRRLATEQLQYMRESARADQDLTVERGLEALERGDYAAAHQAFEIVRQDADRSKRDGQRIALAVRRVNLQRHLVRAGRKALLADDTARFGDLHVQFELLWRWLHSKDPQRDMAAKCLETIGKRLKTLRRVAAQGKNS